MSKRKTHEEFIEEMAKIDKNIKILSDYVTSNQKVECMCKVCGNIWYSTPTNLLKPRGCPECGAKKSIKKRTKTQEQFIKELSEKHSDISVVGKYENNHTKIELKCNKCSHQWFMTPTTILKNKTGCPMCAKNKEEENKDIILNSWITVNEYLNTKIKMCTECGKVLPATTEFFVKHKEGKYGLHSKCKECQKLYYKINKKHIQQYSKKYYLKNRERKIEYQRQFYKENKEYYKEYNEQWKEENKDYCKEYRKQWYHENKDHCRKYRKQYRKENIEMERLRTQKRRTKQKKLPATLTLEQWTSIKEDFNNQCAYCGMTEEEHLKQFGEQLHQEHFIPLSEGGEYAHNNIIPACRSCNSSKNNSNFFGWYPEQEFYDEEREMEILKHLNYLTEDMQQLSIL